MQTHTGRLSDDAVVVHLQGGLGNQLFQYAAVSSAAARDDRPLYLDVGSLASGSRTYELGAFPLPAPLLVGWAARTVPRPESRWPWQRRRRGVHRVVERSLEHGTLLNRLPPRAWVTGYWQSERYFTHVATDVRSTFRTRTVPLTASCTAWGERLRADPNLVSVHVRRGDYTQPGVREVHGLLPISYYEEAYQLAVDDGAQGAVVFSDDVAWARENLPLRNARFVEPHEAHEDLLLMSLCRRHIIANSSFSWWGAWLANAGLVVAPQRWALHPRLRNSTLIPTSWVTV